MLKWINKKRNKKGFTLVELVVVIAILGILAAIAIPKLGSSRDTAKIATHNANVRILKSAATMYIADNPQHAGNDTKDMIGELGAYLDLDEDEVLKAPNVNSEEKLKGQPYEVFITIDGNIKVEPGEITAKEEPTTPPVTPP